VKTPHHSHIESGGIVRAMIMGFVVVFVVLGLGDLKLGMDRAPDVILRYAYLLSRSFKAEYIFRLIRVDTVNLKFN
jgi:hypothetical protein